MRDIEFRGKRVDTGEWVFGFYVIDGDGWYIINDRDADDMRRGEWLKVHPETVGQYTGIEDKNGNKIFDGDVVRVCYFALGVGDNLGAIETEEELTGTIEYGKLGLWIKRIRDKNGKWCAYTGYEQEDGDCLITYLHDVYDETSEDFDFEVIGNIHDNLELLEKKHG